MTVEKWEKLEQKRVVFGHQSVGHNILRGVQTLAGREASRFRRPLSGAIFPPSEILCTSMSGPTAIRCRSCRTLPRSCGAVRHRMWTSPW